MAEGRQMQAVRSPGAGILKHRACRIRSLHDPRVRRELRNEFVEVTSPGRDEPRDPRHAFHARNRNHDNSGSASGQSGDHGREVVTDLLEVDLRTKDVIHPGTDRHNVRIRGERRIQLLVQDPARRHAPYSDIGVLSRATLGKQICESIGPAPRSTIRPRVVTDALRKAVAESDEPGWSCIHDAQSRASCWICSYRAAISRATACAALRGRTMTMKSMIRPASSS